MGGRAQRNDFTRGGTRGGTMIHMCKDVQDLWKVNDQGSDNGNDNDHDDGDDGIDEGQIFRLLEG